MFRCIAVKLSLKNYNNANSFSGFGDKVPRKDQQATVRCANILLNRFRCEFICDLLYFFIPQDILSLLLKEIETLIQQGFKDIR
jgi:hypothetical protein